MAIRLSVDPLDILLESVPKSIILDKQKSTEISDDNVFLSVLIEKPDKSAVFPETPKNIKSTPYQIQEPMTLLTPLSRVNQ
jgi:hypothetical protein